MHTGTYSTQGINSCLVMVLNCCRISPLICPRSFSPSERERVRETMAVAASKSSYIVLGSQSWERSCPGAEIHNPAHKPHGDAALTPLKIDFFSRRRSSIYTLDMTKLIDKMMRGRRGGNSCVGVMGLVFLSSLFVFTSTSSGHWAPYRSALASHCVYWSG